MSNSQQHLHSENFDLCRICLLEPESNRSIKFLHIFATSSGGVKLNQLMLELLGMKVNSKDVKPKIVCENCYKTLLNWVEMKKKCSDTQIVIDYIAKKKFGATVPEIDQSTSNQLVLSSTNNNESTNKSNSFIRSQTKLKKSNGSALKSFIQTNYCNSGSSDQGNSSQLLTTNKSSESDDENDDNDNIDDDDDDDDDDSSCQEVNINHEIIYISDSEDSVKSEFSNDVKFVESHYCSICKKRKHYNHSCSRSNKEFSTCLVPNCNIMFRSMRDFIPHYRTHIGFSSRNVLCRICYQERQKFGRDPYGSHTCHTENLFKCYSCNVKFNSMPEFANHKFKMHNGILINSTGNFLCFYCENSSGNLNEITEHVKHCREDQIKKNKKCPIKLKKSKLNKKKLKNESKNTKNKIHNFVSKSKKSKKLCTSKHKLFTCLKQSCNLIFQSFPVFKFHHREHFGIGNSLMCWQCCSPFSNLNHLRAHQVQGNCRTPGMFKCFECHEEYDDIQSLSIHKYTVHDGDLICKNKKTMNCIFCKFVTNIDNFKTHLVQCQNEKTISNSTPMKSSRYRFKCVICNKVCLTSAALSSHKKTHYPNNKKKTVEINELHDTNNYKETDEQMDLTLPSTSQHNGTVESSNYDKTSNNKKTVEKKIVTSNTSVNCNKFSINYDKVKYADGYYFCTKCPKKFHTKKGLSKHWLFCANTELNSMETLPCNYYCTKCNEYYTRIGFGKHWRLKHGKSLPCSKYKRYSCRKCPRRFVYKIAMTMHREHVHSELNNPAIREKTPVLPIISETISLPEICSENCNEIIKEEFTYTLLDNSKVKCGESVNVELDTVIEYKMNESNNSGNNEKHDKSKNNDSNNIDDVQIVQYENKIVNQSNNAEMTIHDEGLRVVSSVNENEDIDYINHITPINEESKHGIVEIINTQNIEKVV